MSVVIVISKTPYRVLIKALGLLKVTESILKAQEGLESNAIIFCWAIQTIGLTVCNSAKAPHCPSEVPLQASLFSACASDSTEAAARNLLKVKAFLFAVKGNKMTCISLHRFSSQCLH